MSDWGIDVAGAEDVDPSDQMASGRLLLAQEVAKRYRTPRGRLIDDSNYGEDLTAYVNDDMGPADVAAMQAAAVAEAEKDARVQAASALVTLNVLGDLSVEVTLTDSDGPFKLFLSVSAVTVELLAVQP